MRQAVAGAVVDARSAIPPLMPRKPSDTERRHELAERRPGGGEAAPSAREKAL
jgi:hypothetical protein